MKITAVETYLLRFPVDTYRYGASSKGWIRDRSSLLVQAPAGPGLGITINPEVLARYRVA